MIVGVIASAADFRLALAMRQAPDLFELRGEPRATQYRPGECRDRELRLTQGAVGGIVAPEERRGECQGRE